MLRRTQRAQMSSGVLFACLGLLSAAACNDNNNATGNNGAGSDGPAVQGPALPVNIVGDVALGRDTYRFETFNNERFFTDALRLPAGLMAAGVTPRQLLALGVNVDVDALPADLRTAITNNPNSILDNTAMLVAFFNANAVIGMPIKDTNGDGVLDVTKGDKIGTSCSLCHSIATDGAIYTTASGGSIGKRMDGRANHNLNFGRLMAYGTNTRALYPLLQLTLAANGNKTLGRAPTGITESSTEADVDAYLSNPSYYPIGMFDDTFDGNGDPQHNSALFRQDLAAPFGTDGTLAKLENFSNLVYTGLLDPTNLTTPGGRAFLNKLGGAAGTEIADTYVRILAATGVTGYPFVNAQASAAAGTEDAPLGNRVNDAKLFGMNAYLASLPAPAGQGGGDARGAQLFRTSGCTSCHNSNQGIPVPTFIVPMKTIFPGDNPDTLARRVAPLNPIVNTASNIYDDKTAVVNASIRGDIRGSALPLLLDLWRKPNFLHDNSVLTLDDLFNPTRGPNAPHPFYFTNASDRAAIAAYLRGL